MLIMEDGFTLTPTGTCVHISYKLYTTNEYYFIFTDAGRLMARYYVAFESMKRFLTLKGSENLGELVKYPDHITNIFTTPFASRLRSYQNAKNFKKFIFE